MCLHRKQDRHETPRVFMQQLLFPKRNSLKSVARYPRLNSAITKKYISSYISSRTILVKISQCVNLRGYRRLVLEEARFFSGVNIVGRLSLNNNSPQGDIPSLNPRPLNPSVPYSNAVVLSLGWIEPQGFDESVSGVRRSRYSEQNK